MTSGAFCPGHGDVLPHFTVFRPATLISALQWKEMYDAMCTCQALHPDENDSCSGEEDELDSISLHLETYNRGQDGVWKGQIMCDTGQRRS